jgi:hydroxymethylbilane synthase
VKRGLRLGTRGSRLALRQSTLVADALRAIGLEVQLVTIVTSGDVRQPDTAWGEGAFVGALETALLDDEIDLAVHSAKDVPIAPEAELVIAAYTVRADARDALVGRDGGCAGGLAGLAAGSVIGTDSPRRTGFVLAERPDIEVRPLHGNVDSRLARLDRGEVDALVLAVAGLDRLGRQDRIDAILPPDVVPPAPGQGALAVQVRAGDSALRELVAGIDHRPTRIAVTAEREVLRRSGGGCRAPLGAFATLVGDELRLVGGVVDPSGAGRRFVTRNGSAAEALDLAADVAEELLPDRRWPAGFAPRGAAEVRT